MACTGVIRVFHNILADAQLACQGQKREEIRDESMAYFFIAFFGGLDSNISIKTKTEKRDVLG